MVPARCLHAPVNWLCFLKEITPPVFPLKFEVLDIVIVVVPENSRILLLVENAVQLFLELPGRVRMFGIRNEVVDAIWVRTDIVQFFRRAFGPSQPDIWLQLRIIVVLHVQISC